MIKQSMLTGLLILTFALFSCEEKDAETREPVTSLRMQFVHSFAGQDFALGEEFVTASGEKVVFSRLEYIISNIKLTSADGSIHEVPDSYYFVGQRSKDEAMKNSLLLENLPVKEYTSISFAVGVDPETNGSTDNFEKGELQSGVGMDWTWNTGYKFMNWEGTYFNNSLNDLAEFKFHVGTDENYKERVFRKEFELVKELDQEAHFKVEIADFFKLITMNELPLNDQNVSAVMIGPKAQASAAATALAGIFSLDDIHVAGD